MLTRLCAIFLIGIFSQLAQARDLPDFTELVEKQGAAVVNISVTQAVRNTPPAPVMPYHQHKGDPSSELFKRFAPPQQDHETPIFGSGFIISEDGYILTNTHVLNNAEAITVRFTDKREFKAKIIGSDKRTDVALLKIEASGLPKISQGDPNILKVGEWVLAIGSPFGFENSVSAGIVSAKGRSLPQETFVPFIQTDAAINPGNSGGPLFNLKGEVIGINSQIYTRNGGSMGLSFAIPIDVAMDVAKQLRTSGKVTRGRIGVGLQELTLDLAETFGLSKAGGALISSMEKNGPADKAGMQVSDVILRFDGKVVASATDLPRIVAATPPGNKVTTQVWRRGESKDIRLVVGELHEGNKLAMHGDKKVGNVSTGESVERLGLVLSELSARQKNEMQLKGGLLVEEVQSAAARADLRTGDVILAIGNDEVSSLEQCNNILKQISKGRNAALLVQRGDSAVYIALRLDEK